MKKLLLLMTLFTPALSMAAGYQMRYQSAETMGTSFASDVTGSKTASGFYNNPSQLMSMKDGIHFSGELMGLFPMGDFEDGQSPIPGSDPTADGFASSSFIPSIYYGQKLADNYGLVVTFTIPWATNTEYDDDWIGRFHGVKTYLATYNITPSFVYAVNDKLSVSVGPQIQFMTGELSQILPPPAPDGNKFSMEGDSIGFGAVLSALYKLSDKIKLGFTYKSSVSHTLKGNQSVPSPAFGLGNNGDDVELKLSTPDVITLGATYGLNEKIDLHGSFSWSRWSVLDELKIDNTTSPANSPPATITEWDDTILLAVGADYYMSDIWTFRGGLSYETGAPSDEHRSPRSVDEDRLVIGLGTSFAVSETLSINGALTQLFYLNDPEIDLATVSGKYKGNMATAIRVGVSTTF